jgi:outer membrane protein assembly factor BamB
MKSNIVYVGVKAHVVAIDQNDGRILWQTKLKKGVSGHRFVTLLLQDRRVYAHSYGELFCLDAETGRVLWSNPLEGLGYDLASLATGGAVTSPLLAAEYHRQMQAAASAAHGGGGD